MNLSFYFEQEQLIFKSQKVICEVCNPGYLANK